MEDRQQTDSSTYHAGRGGGRKGAGLWQTEGPLQGKRDTQAQEATARIWMAEEMDKHLGHKGRWLQAKVGETITEGSSDGRRAAGRRLSSSEHGRYIFGLSTGVR